MCTLPKGGPLSLWPGDATFLPKLAPHGLPELTSETVLACAMGHMFADADAMASKLASGDLKGTKKTKPKDPVEAGLHEIRQTIQTFFVMAFTKVTAAVMHASGKLRSHYCLNASLHWEYPKPT